MSEHQYFQAIEAHFIRLRGAPLLLSPADWQVANKWWAAGIPLDLVRRTLDEIFERRSQKGDANPVQSLRYCARAVEAAWREALRAQQAGHREVPPPIDVRARLERLADSLPDELPDAARFGDEIRSLEGSAEEVEGLLAEVDGRAVGAMLAAMSAKARAELTRRVDRDLRALAARMTADELEASRSRLIEQRLRRRVGLPILSLFSET